MINFDKVVAEVSMTVDAHGGIDVNNLEKIVRQLQKGVAHKSLGDILDMAAVLQTGYISASGKFFCNEKLADKWQGILLDWYIHEEYEQFNNLTLIAYMDSTKPEDFVAVSLVDASKHLSWIAA